MLSILELGTAVIVLLYQNLVSQIHLTKEVR